MVQARLHPKEKLRAKIAMLSGDEEVLVFTYRERKCVILRTHVLPHFNAYAETKLKGQPYNRMRRKRGNESDAREYGGFTPEQNISCHGGITFAGTLPKHKEWFFGMDFAHYGDYVEMPDYRDKNNETLVGWEEGKHWTLEEVKEETMKLCDEIIAYEQKYGKVQRGKQKAKK